MISNDSGAGTTIKEGGYHKLVSKTVIKFSI
jgi:hypothetical protein